MLRRDTHDIRDTFGRGKGTDVYVVSGGVYVMRSQRRMLLHQSSVLFQRRVVSGRSTSLDLSVLHCSACVPPFSRIQIVKCTYIFASRGLVLLRSLRF